MGWHQENRNPLLNPGSLLRISGIGCLVIILTSCLLCLAVYYLQTGPWLDDSWEEAEPYLPDSADDTLDYFKGEYPYLPGDVQVPEDLESTIESRGLEVYDVQAAVAAAKRTRVDSGHILAIYINASWMHFYEDSFVTMHAIGRTLVENGYRDPPIICPEVTPVPTPEEDQEDGESEQDICVEINPKHKAIMSLYPDGGTAWLNQVLGIAGEWDDILSRTEVEEFEPDSFWYIATIFIESLRIRMAGYQEGNILVMVDGKPVIKGVEVPPEAYPEVPDGYFVHPYPGATISGYRFGDPVYDENGNLIRAHHPGVDLGKAGGGPVVAACNGRVTHAGWMNSTSLWISGIVVAITCNPPEVDSTQICTLYGHGAEGTLKVSEGDRVNAGDWLFMAGSTGASTGVHLHFDIRTGEGKYCSQSIDPMPYIQ